MLDSEYNSQILYMSEHNMVIYIKLCKTYFKDNGLCDILVKFNIIDLIATMWEVGDKNK